MIDSNIDAYRRIEYGFVRFGGRRWGRKVQEKKCDSAMRVVNGDCVARLPSPPGGDSADQVESVRSPVRE